MSLPSDPVKLRCTVRLPSNQITFDAVNKAEFDTFVNSYPTPLAKGVATACQPPVRTYADLLLGEYPENVVAMCALPGVMPEGPHLIRSNLCQASATSDDIPV